MTSNKCNIRVKVFTGHSLQRTEEDVNNFLANLDQNSLIDIKIGRAGDMPPAMGVMSL